MNRCKIFGILFIFLFLVCATVFVMNKAWKINVSINLNKPSGKEYLLLYERNNHTKYKKLILKDNFLSGKVSLDTDNILIKTLTLKDIPNAEIKSIYVNNIQIGNFDDYLNARNNIKNSLQIKFFALSFAGILLIFLFLFLLYKYIWQYRLQLLEFFNSKKLLFQKLLVFFFFAGFLFALFPFKYSYEFSLDYSWQYAMNYFFNNPSFIAGKDYFFTYGPLGFIMAPLDFNNNLILALCINFIVLLIAWLLLLYQFLTKQIDVSKLAVFSLLFFMFIGLCDENLWIFTALVLVFGINKYCKKNILLASFLAITLSILSAVSLFTKINLGVELFCLSGVCYLILLYKLKKQSLKLLYCYLIPYILILLLAIKTLYINFENFVNWLEISLEIAKGYAYSMVVHGSYIQLGIAIFIFIAILYLIYDSYKKEDETSFVNLLLILPVFYFAFKHGFILHYGHHTLGFFVLMFYLFGLVYIYSENASKKIQAAFVCIFFICVSHIYPIRNNHFNNFPHITYNIMFLSNIAHYKEHFKSSNNYTKKIYDTICPQHLPQIEVNKKLEIIPWHIAYIKNYENCKLSVNPILQLYSVYTKKLDNISSLHYKNLNSPDYIIMENLSGHVDSFIRSNMYLENPNTWNIILSNYKIKESGEKYLLLDRRTEPKKYSLKLIKSGIYKLNESIVIPDTDKILYAKIYIKPTIIEQIKRLLYRGSSIRLDIKYQNKNKQYIVLETMFSGNPVIINYIPESNENNDISDWKYLFNNDFNKIKKCSQIKFMANKLFYSENFKIEWYMRYD